MTATPRRLSGELGFTVVLLAGSGFLLHEAYGISGFESLTSAGVFPMLATGAMVACLLVVLLRTLRTPRCVPQAGESLARHFVRRLAPPELVAFAATITAYMFLLDRLGFLVASYLFLVVSMALLGSRRWVLNLLVSAVTLAAIYAVFQTVFSVVLPKGSWLTGWLR